jgi:hypothetical protein
MQSRARPARAGRQVARCGLLPNTAHRGVRQAATLCFQRGTVGAAIRATVLSTGAARGAILPIPRPARRIKLPRKKNILPTLLVVGRRYGRAHPYVAPGDVVECEPDHRLALLALMSLSQWFASRAPSSFVGVEGQPFHAILPLRPGRAPSCAARLRSPRPWWWNLGRGLLIRLRRSCAYISGHGPHPAQAAGSA